MSSNRGKPASERFDEKWEAVTESGCYIWTGAVSRTGYGSFRASRKIVTAHRFAYERIYGEQPNKYICHKCDTPLCVNPSHMFSGDQYANMKDMSTKGRRGGPLGKAHHFSGSGIQRKLALEQAKTVLTSDLSTRELAAMFGVSFGAINAIRSGKSWKWLREDMRRV